MKSQDWKTGLWTPKPALLTKVLTLYPSEMGDLLRVSFSVVHFNSQALDLEGTERLFVPFFKEQIVTSRPLN